MSSPIELRVEGQAYSDWLTASVAVDLDAPVVSFTFAVSERWGSSFLNIPLRDWRIPAGSQCEVFIHGQRVMSGAVDEHSPSTNSNDHSVTITGRSSAKNLVDCSLVHPTYRWSGDIGTIVRDVVSQHGLPVVIDTDLGEAASFQVEAGVTCFEVIRQLSEKHGFLAVPTKEGGISLTRAADDELPYEINCPESVSFRNDLSGRFSHWIVKGQQHGFDLDDPLEAANVQGIAVDTAVSEYRPKIITSQGDTPGVSAEAEAQWNMARSIGNSLSANLSIPDFLNPDGDLWWVNQICRVKSDRDNFNQSMIISAVSFEISNQGTNCNLTFKHPLAYTPRPQAAIGARVQRRVSGSDAADRPAKYYDDVTNARTSQGGSGTIDPISLGRPDVDNPTIGDLI